jgi:hypothetical protein
VAPHTIATTTQRCHRPFMRPQTSRAPPPTSNRNLTGILFPPKGGARLRRAVPLPSCPLKLWPPPQRSPSNS